MEKGLEKMFKETCALLCNIHENIDNEYKIKISEILFRVTSLFEINEKKISHISE